MDSRIIEMLLMKELMKSNQGTSTFKDYEDMEKWLKDRDKIKKEEAAKKAPMMFSFFQTCLFCLGVGPAIGGLSMLGQLHLLHEIFNSIMSFH